MHDGTFLVWVSGWAGFAANWLVVVVVVVVGFLKIFKGFLKDPSGVQHRSNGVLLLRAVQGGGAIWDRWVRGVGGGCS